MRDKKRGMKDKITEIKRIMADVSTGVTRIQDANESYIKLYKSLDKYFSKNVIKNPNTYSDLWEFYHYWSKNLPKYSDRRVYISNLYKLQPANLSSQVGGSHFVDPRRLQEIKDKRGSYDYKKLAQMLGEINFAYSNMCHLSVIILIRAILNHIPPVFGYMTFKEVSSNYGKSSFKSIALKLEESSRKIADSYLHDPIRKRESLPTKTQVNFSQELDYILGELIVLD